MRLPSVKQLMQKAVDTFGRFPFAILSAVIGTGSVLVIMQYEFHSYHQNNFWLYNTSAVAFLGISIFTALQLIAEKKTWKFSLTLGFKLSISCLLVVYYYLLPQNIFESESVHLIRYLLFAIAAHLFVAVAPSIEQGHIAGFWEFNKSLFLRFLTAALYSGVLFAGLAIALAAIENLFAIDIKEIRYMQLWWIISGIFNTWFFLSGVPHRTDIVDENIRYPKGLKVFTQYVLIPLVAVYVCILYAYMGKIIIEWDWPKGWVGYLVLGFSITGILSLLLIHPIKDRKENSWMAVVWQWFYVVLLPLTVLLLLAIWRRTSEYGITENRYFVIVLGFWLAAVALHFLISKTKSIKIIPISLCLIALLASFGPWGAFSISEYNQLKRLEEVLIKNNLLVNNKAQKAKSDITFADAKRISSIVRYLAETHGVGALQPWFEEQLDTLETGHYKNRYYSSSESSKRITQILGVRYIGEWERDENDGQMRNYTFNSDSLHVVPLNGYQYLVQNIKLNCANRTEIFKLGTKEWKISLISDSTQLLYIKSQNTSESCVIDLKERLSLLQKDYAIYEYGSKAVPQNLMVITAVNRETQMQLFFQTITISVKEKKIVPTELTMDIVISINK
jgi:hypothetical protein